MLTSSVRSQVMQRWSMLKDERSTWIDHWQDLGQQLQPRRPRFLVTDRNIGVRKNQNIINGTPLRAVRTLSSGMMSGITSPARPWFRLAATGLYSKSPGVVKWLYEVERRMSEVMARSNLYNALPIVYTDLGVFGTSAMVVEEDEEDVVRAYVLPVGQYALASSFRLSVDTIYRELSMTVGQLVQRFGLNRVSSRIRRAWLTGKRDQWVTVIHAVEPRYTNDYTAGVQADMEQLPPPNKPKPFDGTKVRTGLPELTDEPRGQDMGADMQPLRGGSGLPTQPTREPGTRIEWAPAEMPWRSVWMEADANEEPNGGVLHEGGFNEWPVMCPRWEITGEDVYGSSPGMNALGDARALQLYERRKGQAIDKLVNPPMKGPSSLRNQRHSTLPGDVTYLDQLGPGTTFEPSMVIQPMALSALKECINEHEQRINAAFYADLWLAITNDERSIPATAREIVERHEEKMLQLGPTLERIQDELLDPMIERVFGIMERRGLIPPPPPELQGQPIRVEYISVMSKAQKLVGTAAVERLVQLTLSIAAAVPTATQKIDWDALQEEYADMVGTAPQLVKDQGRVDQERQAQAQAAQQERQSALAAQGAQTTKALAASPLDQDNALSRLMTSIGAAPTPGPGGI